jgi:anionic cell wall polymer biosynthesis LytR-Cps2A-Psr (LCP) family protein
MTSPHARRHTLALFGVLIACLFLPGDGPVGATHARGGDAFVELSGLGLVDTTGGIWHLRTRDGDPTSFYYGDPGDLPIVGDWNCDGFDTPGMYRPSDGFVYLRNSNTQGGADISFFGNPGDIALAGDFNGDGCDTVSLYRPSESRVLVINHLGADGGPLGLADYSYVLGNPGDRPFVGDFNGDGIDTIGLHRESTGLVYLHNTHSEGAADLEFYVGEPSDLLVMGDWTGDGVDTPAVFRPGDRTMYLWYANASGPADEHFTWGEPEWVPVAGLFGPVSSGVSVNLPGAPQGAARAVESLYLELPAAPHLPEGMRSHLAGLSTAPGSTTVDGSYSGDIAYGAHLAVVTTTSPGPDTILLVSDDGSEWRVVGAHLASQGRTRWYGGSTRFVAVIGADIGGDPDPMFSRADSVTIISLVPGADPSTGAIVGIPRDTVVRVPYPNGETVTEACIFGLIVDGVCHGEMVERYCTGYCHQLNQTMRDGRGPGVTVTALRTETGLPIEGYFLTGFGTHLAAVPGFSDLVDAYAAAHGAFEFLVPYFGNAGFPVPGQTTITGAEALRFAMERGTLMRGTIDRALAHGLLMKAAIANVKPLGILSTPGLLAIMDDFVRTDLSADAVLTFAATLFTIDHGPMPTFTPEQFDEIGSPDVYDLNHGSLPYVVVGGCNTPGFFNEQFAYWFETWNREVFADLADGTLSPANIPPHHILGC